MPQATWKKFEVKNVHPNSIKCQIIWSLEALKSDVSVAESEGRGMSNSVFQAEADDYIRLGLYIL